jgi:ABC-type transport system substrate-binding protein
MVLEMRTRITIVVVTAVVLAGCGGGSPETDIDSDTGGLKIYRHSMDEMPTSLDPVQSANVYANHVNINAYDTLYAYKYLARPYTLKANLAADFPEIAEDGLTYTIRIKQGVYFVDDPAFPDGKGREVVAEDFVYSIKRHFDPTTRPQGAWLWQGRIVGLDEWKEAGSDYSAEVEGLRALDRYTIQVRLIRPYPQLLYTFTQGYSAIVPVEAVEKYGREFASRPVGSGPFKVVSYDTSKIVFDRNPNYRQEPVDLEYEGYDPARHSHLGLKVIEGRAPPFVDRLEINFINESSARWNSFTKGNEIQFATLPIEIADQVLSSKDPVTLQPEYWTSRNSVITRILRARRAIMPCDARS